jgi:hypothetical protein
MLLIETLQQAEEVVHAIQLYGAGGFGAIIGWYIYYINRYRKNDVQLSDLVTLIGVIGGAAILALFPAGSMLFGAYGIGLAAGFFGYFFVLVILVSTSDNFDPDWFLDGRRKLPDGTTQVPKPGEVPQGGQGMVDEAPATGLR